jgi:small subunit ribosomal protein S17
MKKTVRRSKNYHAHDEANAAKVGHMVFIQESRPHSKLKTWELVADPKAGGPGLLDKIKSAVGLGSDKG